MDYRVLAINPGSTSTKISVYDDRKKIFTKVLNHDAKELEACGGVIQQYDYRKKLVLEALQENNINPNTLHAVSGRGGLMKAIPGGTYKVNEAMKADLSDPNLWGRIHASNLGAFIAESIAKEYNIPAYIVDPVCVDEFEEFARVSGIPEIKRQSLFHALNIRYIALLLSEKLGKPLNECNMIAIHMGGGVTVAAIKNGKVVDANNALLGMGPFSPQRAGALPIGDLINMCYSGEWTKKELETYLTKKAGWMAYIGTSDGLTVENKIKAGDKNAEFYRDAMCYQVAKDVGACATVLNGKVDLIFASGGLVYDKNIVKNLEDRCGFIAPFEILPGEKEMEALSQGAVRVLKGFETAKEYK